MSESAIHKSKLSKAAKPIPKVVASIEARMGSSRLPGKVLKDIGGQPALTRLLRRLRHCKRLDSIILATTTSPKDDVLVAWAQKEDVSYYRGSEDDVLNRVVTAQQAADSDIVVEICGDCVLIDPSLVDMAIWTFLENRRQFVCQSFLKIMTTMSVIATEI